MPFDRNIATYSTRRVRRDGDVSVPDCVAVEEPMRLFVQNIQVGTTLRTPGDDIALAAGWCLTAGWIESADDIVAIRQENASRENDVFVQLTDARWEKVRENTSDHDAANGRELVEEVAARLYTPPKVAQITAKKLQICRNLLENRQKMFGPTGCTHAAALFDIRQRLLSLGEDVGRHNALDKAIGHAVLDGTLTQATLGFITSRASFEMVQKALRARLAFLSCTSGPTSLAIDLAKQAGLSLAAFVRPNGFTAYSGLERFDFTKEFCEETHVEEDVPSVISFTSRTENHGFTQSGVCGKEGK